MADEIKISSENAESQFNEWLDFYDIVFDDIVREQTKEGAETIANKVKRAIQTGRLEIVPDDPNGFTVVQHTMKGVELRYSELSGQAKAETDRYTGNITKVYALLGKLSGLGLDAIKQLKGRDLGLAECIGAIFLVA